MPHFTILNIIQATIIVALSCALARYIGRDLLSTFIAASSCSGVGIGLWCGVTRTMKRPHWPDLPRGEGPETPRRMAA
jgi:hypothetical protein